MFFLCFFLQTCEILKNVCEHIKTFLIALYFYIIKEFRIQIVYFLINIFHSN